MNFTSHSHGPSKPSSFLWMGDAGKKHYETLKGKPKQGLGGNCKRKGSLGRLNLPLDVFQN